MITPSFGLTATERVLPKLALDFTTASLDSRVTFTRTTSASNPATYVNSSGYITEATNNQPRFDYDPITLACKGLLIEEARINQCLYSKNLAAGAGWTANAVTMTANQLTAPNNNTEAALYNEGTTSAQHYVSNAASSVTSGTTYTASVYVKAGTVQWFQIPLSSGTFGVNAWGNFDIVNGVVGNKGSAATTSIVNAGNGWWRCIISAPATATTSAATLQIAFCGDTDTASRLPSTTGTSKTMYVWGAQVEAGAFATSYIPTTTTALTRNADVATMTGTNFSDWFNASEGTFVGWAIPMTTNSTVRSPVCTVSNGTASNIMTFGQATVAAGGTTLSYYVADGAVEQAYLTASGQAAANTLYKVSMSYKANSFNASFKGNAPVSDTSGTVPTVDQLVLGSGVSKLGNSWISKLFYYPMLTNAELQSFAK